jgi:hypothetical protein
VTPGKEVPSFLHVEMRTMDSNHDIVSRGLGSRSILDCKPRQPFVPWGRWTVDALYQ